MPSNYTLYETNEPQFKQGIYIPFINHLLNDKQICFQKYTASLLLLYKAKSREGINFFVKLNGY